MSSLPFDHLSGSLEEAWYAGEVRVRLGDAHQGKTVVTFTAGGTDHEFELVEIPRLNAATAARLGDDGAASARPLVVFAERITPALAEILLSKQIGYVDAAGNAHIERPPLLLHIEGKKRERTQEAAPVRVFSGEGLKVVFALLLGPTLTSRPYRDMAELAGVSHGVVQYAMKDLERLGFVLRLSRTERRLQNRADLLDRWATAYAETLRPKLTWGTYRFADAKRVASWDTLALDDARWGGEPAAALTTGYLKPADFSLYTHLPKPDAMRRLRTLPDSDGQVEMLRAFWPAALEMEVPEAFPDRAVPDVLAYADLLASDDPRNADTAALLRERILADGAS
jgi:hypothetical protein